MGYLLKEALKTLCGVNQWSYAVFWKIGSQNPNLLIWEDCYYEPASYSGLPGTSNPQTAYQDQSGSWISPETAISQSVVHSADKVDSLVNKMMMDNHVKILGQGLVGRAGFTGNHDWILYDNFFKDTHPPEVCKEMCQQFSAGMQTVAVIPVLPHGVVQFGSYKSIMENVGFVSDVTALVSQLGFVPDIVQSQNYPIDDPEPRYGVPVFCMNSTPGEYSLGSNMIDSSSLYDSFNYLGSSSSMFDSQTCYSLATEIQNNLESQIPGFQASNLNEAKMKLDFSPPNLVIDGVPKAEVIPSNSEVWMKQLDLSSSSSSTLNQNSKNVIISKDATKSHTVPSFQQNNHLTMGEQKFEGLTISGYDDASQPQSGDDLFDILGADFKNNFFSSFSNSSSKTEFPANMHNWDGSNFPSKSNSEIRSTSQGNPKSGIFSLNGTDHLLDAVVSSKANCPAKQKLDDNLSCRTTLTNTSSSSSLPYGRFGVSEQHLKGELFSVPKYQAKEDSVSYSQSSSIYGSSQVSSWSENLQSSSKPNKSASTGYSKKPDETGKTNKKRLKPGENPRPRPKDRQMIQDRVKELRDIVPNGAKCSIDALLERTIKHMLFLQSVTKHADKLKQAGDSKIISKDGGLLLKDNFEGGATWAYEVGSQSTVCPIIVEDLNQPRQMLIEMLCEERGLFLEIADIIRGLGLTILKGVMETRNDKIWARFAVEANRDVTRMEIFISLVRLWEPTAKTGSTSQQPNGENMMVQEINRGVLSLPMNCSQ